VIDLAADQADLGEVPGAVAIGVAAACPGLASYR
jgi:hypothetical protein